MIGQGLSLDQSPPFEATGRFFLSAPVFIILAGFVMLFYDVSLFRGDPNAVAVIHLFTLGVFTMVIFGAVQQMLPVLAGAKIAKPMLVAVSTHLFLVFGIAMFIVSFLYVDSFWTAILAAISIFLAFSIVLLSAVFALKDTTLFSPTVKAISVAVFAGLITLFLGIWLLLNFIFGYSSLHNLFMAVHMVWGVFGFIGILIIGVSFQIIPMFYVAPNFRDFFTKWLIWLTLLGVFFWTIFTLFFPAVDFVPLTVLAIVFTAFAVEVFLKLNKRRRPISDVTVWYWRLASFSLFIGIVFLLLNKFMEIDLDMFVLVFIGGGFILSIITGMLYKIVPFLVWFHLNAKGHFKMPTMREMIDEKISKIQFFMHIIALVSVLSSFYFPILIKLSALFFIFSGSLILFNLLKATKVYNGLKDVDPMAEFLVDTPA